MLHQSYTTGIVGHLDFFPWFGVFFQAVLGWVFVKFLVLLVKGFFCVCVFVLFTNTKLK